MKNYIFDLDNTLYSHKNGLFDSQLIRMTNFIKNLLKISHKEAEILRDELYFKYGSTMDGLIDLYNINGQDFIKYIDEIDISNYSVDLPLKKKLLELKIKGKNLYVFTNASKYHADRVLKQLELFELFDGIVTLECTGLIPKPQLKAFEYIKEEWNIDFNDSVFFEDTAHNLIPAKKLGMQTVLVHAIDDKSSLDFEKNKEIDFYVEDIVSFLDKKFISIRV